MLKQIIDRENKLEREVEISGSKNASLPIIAATIINEGITTLYNMTKIRSTVILVGALIGKIIK